MSETPDARRHYPVKRVKDDFTTYVCDVDGEMFPCAFVSDAGSACTPSRHDATPGDSHDGLLDKLRRARAHELHNYDQWMKANFWMATLIEDVREARDRCDDYDTDNPDVRMGLDLAAGWLDVLLAKHAEADSHERAEL